MVGLDPREVSSFTLREAVLAVQLELSSDDRVLAPAVHIQRGFSQNEGTSIRDSGVLFMTVGSQVLELGKDGRSKVGGGSRLGNSGTTKVGLIVRVGRTVPVSSESRRNIVIKGTSVLEQATGINVRTRISSNRCRAAKSMIALGKASTASV